LIPLAALIAAVAIVWAARTIAASIEGARDAASHARMLTILGMFAPAIASAQSDVRMLLVWQPLARSARTLFPEEFAAIDRANRATFPFTAERLRDGHAQWTAAWLAWERSHDGEFKRRVAEAEHELAAADRALLRGRLDAIEREKLDSYQRRYEEYVRVAKALQALCDSAA